MIKQDQPQASRLQLEAQASKVYQDYIMPDDRITLEQYLKSLSKYIFWVFYLNSILNLIAIISQGIWYISKGPAKQTCQDTPKSEKLIKDEEKADKWIVAVMFVSAGIIILHYILKKHIHMRNGRVYFLILIMLLCIGSMVILAFCSVLSWIYMEYFNCCGSSYD